jgi:hypothetical protein
MLTGKMVRVRFARDRILPYYIDVQDPARLEVASRLVELFRGQEGHTRGEIEDEQRELFGDDPGQLVHQGLAKLLEDRCEFEVVAGLPPEQIREAVFRVAADRRRSTGESVELFDRCAVLSCVAEELGLTAHQLDQGMFADLKSEQRLISFKDITPHQLLERYNVALAQAVILKATSVQVTVRDEPPQRYRQLLRRIKFHRLLCEVERTSASCCRLTLDGPLSLFSATQKYGLQLALFLPAVLLCRDFDLKAEIRWEPQRKPKTFLLCSKDGFVSHYADTGIYVPPELQMFVDLFRKKIADWDISDDTEATPLGAGFWVPDFRLVHRETGKSVWMEVLGFWRKASAEAHLKRLRAEVREPFLLAVSDRLNIDEAALEDVPAGVHRFRSMPLPEEIARLARELIGGANVPSTKN